MANKKDVKKNATNKKEKKKVLSPKHIAIIAAAVAVIAVALFLIFDDGIPKAVRTEIEASITKQIGDYDIKAVDCEKRYVVENSEHDKETIYLVSGELKKNGKLKNLDGTYVLVLASVTEDDGVEKITVKNFGLFEEKEALKERINIEKKRTAEWSADIAEEIAYQR